MAQFAYPTLKVNYNCKIRIQFSKNWVNAENSFSENPKMFFFGFCRKKKNQNIYGNSSQHKLKICRKMEIGLTLKL